MLGWIFSAGWIIVQELDISTSVHVVQFVNRPWNLTYAFIMDLGPYT